MLRLNRRRKIWMVLANVSVDLQMSEAFSLDSLHNINFAGLKMIGKQEGIVGRCKPLG